MGIASRTKWEARIGRKPEKRARFNPEKLVTQEVVYGVNWLDRTQGLMIEQNRARRCIEATDRLTKIRQRKAAARKRRPWQPYAAR